MSFDQTEMTVNEQIRYLCDLLHGGTPLFDNCCLLLKELNRFLKSAVSNWYWFNEQNNNFILFASSSDTLSNYGENQVRLNDFFLGRLFRNNFEPYQIFIQKTGRYKLFLIKPLHIHGSLAGCILVQSITSSSDFDYENYFLHQLITILNFELPGILQINNPTEYIGYSVLEELSYIYDQITNIRHLAKVVVQNACLVFEAQTSILSLHNPTMNCFEILDVFSYLDNVTLSHVLKFDNTVAMKTATTATLFTKDNLMIKRLDQNRPASFAVISICLRNKETILGALSLYGKKQINAYENKDFSLTDQELFVNFSDCVSRQLNRFLLSGI